MKIKVREINEKDYFTTIELAKVLGISRVSVFKRVKQGSIMGQKIGRDFIIFKRDIDLNKLKTIVKHN
jgi:excisionase family DNA binding protein